MRFRTRIFEVIETAKSCDRASRVFDIFLVVLIISNILAVILGTVASIEASLSGFFWWFELISVVLFSFEYVLRVWTAVLKKRYRSPISGRLKYICSPMAIVDLLAILPFYLPMLIPVDLRFLRALRLFRLLRLLKIGRYSKAMQVVGSVLRRKRADLTITLVIILVLLIISASLLYYVEHDAQPDKFSSIPETLWWSICTLTTVGYGDVIPITPLGKTCAGFIALLGIGTFALPAGIFASGFENELSKKGRKHFECPNCSVKLYLGEELLKMRKFKQGDERS